MGFLSPKQLSFSYTFVEEVVLRWKAVIWGERRVCLGKRRVVWVIGVYIRDWGILETLCWTGGIVSYHPPTIHWTRSKPSAHSRRTSYIQPITDRPLNSDQSKTGKQTLALSLDQWEEGKQTREVLGQMWPLFNQTATIWNIYTSTSIHIQTAGGVNSLTQGVGGGTQKQLKLN